MGHGIYNYGLEVIQTGLSDITDSSGNGAKLNLPNAGAANSLAVNNSLIIDTSPPSMTISASNGNESVLDGSATNDSELTLTFTSSEATTNFTEQDITVTGGALSNFNASVLRFIQQYLLQVMKVLPPLMWLRILLQMRQLIIIFLRHSLTGLMIRPHQPC